MGKNLFSVPIFFIVFRETLEAAIIISVLLGLVEQIVQDDPNRLTNVVQTTAGDSTDDSLPSPVASDPEDATIRSRRLIRKLRIQVIVRCNVIRDASNQCSADFPRRRSRTPYCNVYWCCVRRLL